MNTKRVIKISIGILGGIAIGVLGNMVDRWLGFDIVPDKIATFINSITDSIIKGVSVRLPIWYLLAVAVCAYLIGIAIRHYKLKKLKVEEQPIKYDLPTSGVFGITNDRWIWSYDDEGNVHNVLPLCPVCSSIGIINLLHPNNNVPGNSQTFIDCPKCRLAGRAFQFELNSLNHDVYYEIHNRVKDAKFIQDNAAKKPAK